VTEEALRGRDQDFDFIYNEIKEVTQSQATLNSAVSDWRSESQEHFSALASRLDKLDPSTASQESRERPVPAEPSFDLPAAIRPKDGTGIALNNGAKAAEGAAEVSVKADDYQLPPEPGRGFWYWLFGTSSLSAANRKNQLKLAHMRENIRESRERRRTQI
jgi:hypothetical protein